MGRVPARLVIGATWPAIFAPYLTILLVIAVLQLITITWAWLKQISD